MKLASLERAQRLVEVRAKGKFDVRLLSKEVALITYPLQLKGTFKGTKLLSKNYASSVWVKHGGQWQEAFYQETPVAGAQ